MNRILILLFIVLSFLSVKSQNLRKGTYVGDVTTDFLIVSNDSVCYRFLTSSGFLVSTIGVGTYDYKDGELHVKTCEKIYQATTEVLINKRMDSLFSFRILDFENNPLCDGFVSINHQNTYKKKDSKCGLFNWFPKEQKEYILTNKDGYIDQTLFEDYWNQDIDISFTALGIAELNAKVTIRKGYDIVMRSKIPSELSYGIFIGDGTYKIWMMEDGSLEHIMEAEGYPNHKIIHRLVFLSDDTSLDLDYFSKTYLGIKH